MLRLPADRAVLRMTSELGRVMADAAARERAGERVIHLERGEPDFGTPPHIVEALARAARDGHTHYPEPRGTLALRERVVAKLAGENAMIVHPDDVTITAGGSHGLFLALQALLSPGDEILVLSPYWMAIPNLVGFAAGATWRELPAWLELGAGRWSPADFAAAVRGALGPATRGIYVNSPHNPTGAVLSRAHLEALAAVALERDLWVLSDEAYEHLVFDGTHHVSIASLPGMAERTVSVFTLSKSYAMTGWRVGYVAAPPALRAVLGPVLAFYSTCGVFPAVQQAALAALDGPQDCVAAMREAYAQRRDVLIARLAGAETVRAHAPQGAFYTFPDVAAARAGRDPWALIADWLALGVAVLPGTAFGASYADHVRLSLATRAEDVDEAGRRLASYAAPVERR